MSENIVLVRATALSQGNFYQGAIDTSKRKEKVCMTFNAINSVGVCIVEVSDSVFESRKNKIAERHLPG